VVDPSKGNRKRSELYNSLWWSMWTYSLLKNDHEAFLKTIVSLPLSIHKK
jgi:hypothetical protein